MKKVWIIVASLCLLGIASPAFAADKAAKAAKKQDAFTKYDKNGNGVLDKSEHGIPDVTVSDGEVVTRSDAKGYWKLYPSVASIVFVIKPDDWELPTTREGLPDFWMDIHSEKANRGKFHPQAGSTSPCIARNRPRR